MQIITQELLFIRSFIYLYIPQVLIEHNHFLGVGVATSDRAVSKADQLRAFKKLIFNWNPSSFVRSGYESTIFRGGSQVVNTS